MKVITMSKREFNHLQKLPLPNSVFNTEAVLYLYNAKNKWNKEKKIVKKLYNDEGDVFGNKLLTVNALIDNKEEIGIEELILPEKLISVDEKIVGLTMPYIASVNLEELLKNKDISNAQKIDYLKQVGNILDKIKSVRNHTMIKDFYLNDVHESNFILNQKTNKINVVDLDSSKINGNKPFAARYLTPISNISIMPNKYHVNNEFIYPGYIIANENSDLYCYNMMILNYLYKDSVARLSIDEYYEYMQYLVDIGFPIDVVDSFSKIYEYVDNENVGNLLDTIPEISMFKANKNVYENIKKRKI